MALAAPLSSARRLLRALTLPRLALPSAPPRAGSGSLPERADVPTDPRTWEEEFELASWPPTPFETSTAPASVIALARQDDKEEVLDFIATIHSAAAADATSKDRDALAPTVRRWQPPLDCGRPLSPALSVGSSSSSTSSRSSTFSDGNFANITLLHSAHRRTARRGAEVRRRKTESEAVWRQFWD